MTLDAREYERWIETARQDLRVARHDRSGGFHEAAVLYAEQATQCALKALLHAVGRGDLARGHGLMALARACEEIAGLRLPDPTREHVAELARGYQATRYPDALPDGTPMDHFGEESSERAIATAEEVTGQVTAVWSQLEAAAQEDGRTGQSDEADPG